MPRVSIAGSAGGQVIAHFRGEAASLGAPDAADPGMLVLKGRIAQASYPGGHWRYGIAVGSQHFMVDDTRRLGVGDAVGIGLPLSSLHLFAAGSPADRA